MVDFSVNQAPCNFFFFFAGLAAKTGTSKPGDPVLFSATQSGRCRDPRLLPPRAWANAARLLVLDDSTRTLVFAATPSSTSRWCAAYLGAPLIGMTTAR